MCVRTKRERREEMKMTEKQPRSESARTAPTRGKKLPQPATTLLIWAASMLLMLYSLIKNTIRLADQAPLASVSPNTAAVYRYIYMYVYVGN